MNYRDHIRFTVNGREHRVAGAEAFTTLANWLRYDRGATGTKIVCEEGDCGACTVLVRRGGGEFVPINSCIQLVAQLDGASVVTVEGLRMNAVQEAMVTHHGAQCGYCTPGFVVAMSALFETRDRVDEKQVRDGLTGNLCRCTGYEPIIKAALAVDGTATPKLRDMYPAPVDDGEPVRLSRHPEPAKRGEGSASHVGDGSFAVSAAREDIAFFAPTTLADAIAFKRNHPGCTIVQGATDVGVWITKRKFAAPALLFLGKLRELDDLREDDGSIVAGANVTLSNFEAFTESRIPELHAILNIFGSPQIKNAGTLIGNIANGSPIGDTLPYLLVADAQLELAGTSGTRRVPINSFYLGYKKFDIKADEIITRVVVPIVGCRDESPADTADRRLHEGDSSLALGVRPAADHLKLYKVSRRKDLDISAFTAAMRLRIRDGVIEEARIAYGGVAPTVVRLPKTEQFLAGKPPLLELFERAGVIARGEVTPISDVRGSAVYRSQLAENIMIKCWFDLFDDVPVRDRRGADRPFAGAPA